MEEEARKQSPRKYKHETIIKRNRKTLAANENDNKKTKSNAEVKQRTKKRRRPQGSRNTNVD